MNDLAGLSVEDRLVLGIAGEGQFFGVEPEEVEQRGVVILVVAHLLDGLVSEFVGVSVGQSTPKTASGQPHLSLIHI